MLALSEAFYIIKDIFAQCTISLLVLPSYNVILNSPFIHSTLTQAI